MWGGQSWNQRRLWYRKNNNHSEKEKERHRGRCVRGYNQEVLGFWGEEEELSANKELCLEGKRAIGKQIMVMLIIMQ